MKFFLGVEICLFLQRSGLVVEPVTMDGFKVKKIVGERADNEPYRPYDVCFCLFLQLLKVTDSI